MKTKPAAKPKATPAFLATLDGKRGLFNTRTLKFVPTFGPVAKDATAHKLEVIPRSEARIEAKLAYEQMWRIEHGKQKPTRALHPAVTKES